MRILLVQLSFLGDVVLSTPVISALQKLYPEAELDLLTMPAAKEVVVRDRFVCDVITFDKRKSERGISGMFRIARQLAGRKYDRVYCLHRSIRTAVVLWLARIPHRIGFRDSKGWFLFHETRTRPRGTHEVERNLSIIQPEMVGDEFDDAIRLVAPERRELGTEARTAMNEIENFAIIAPGSVWKTKRWSAQHYRTIVERLLARGLSVIVTGAPSEEQSCREASFGTEALNLVGKTSLSDLMALISRAELVVCNDSMTLHLASGFSRPTVAIFCATSPKFGFGPWKSPHIIVEKDGLACKPCRRHGSMRCPTGTEACMTSLGPNDVWNACQQLL